MNVNRMRISSSSKLILGVVIAICFMVPLAHAQARVSHFNGTFVLTNDVQWGKALLRPGTYSIAVDQSGATTESIRVYDISTGKMVAGEAAAISFNSISNNSQILVAVRGNQRAVESVQLAGMGEVLHQTHPFATGDSRSEEALSTQAIPVETSTK
jgi:hypothetical protein